MITVLIRTYNEEHLLKRCLDALDKQNIEFSTIVIDSHSIDNTVKIAKEHNARVIQYYPFSYGGAINAGISIPKTEYVAVLSGHCFIQTNDYFSLMLNHFEHREVAAVYARQIPSNHSNILDKRNFLMTYRDVPISNYFFNNAASMIKKAVWKEHKFDESIEACEDLIWAKMVIAAGYKIIYEPKAIVEHLHEESITTTLERYKKEYSVLNLI